MCAVRIVPIVVTNQGFGFSLEIEGCRVVEAAFLKTFLGTGSLVAGASMDVRTGAITPIDMTLYETEKQAADRFEAIIARPLYRFVDRIEEKFMPFPSPIGAKTMVTTVHLADVGGDERLLTEMLATT
jgi:hypothetical protein